MLRVATMFAVALIGSSVVVGPAQANDTEDCYSRNVDRVLKGCTRIINSRGVKRADLAEAYAARAGGHFDNNDSKAALLDVDKAIEIDSRNGLAWAWRGHIFNQSNEPQKALESFNNAVTFNPKDAGAWEGRALSRINLGDFTGAVQDGDRSIQVDPKIAAAYVVRGRARAGLEQWEAALGDYERASRVDPKLWSVAYHRGQLYRRIGKLKEALAEAERSVGVDLVYENIVLRGLLKGENGDTRGALVDLDRAIGSWPNGGEAHSGRAIYAAADGDISRALRHATRAVELKHREGLEARGVAYQAAGEHTQAISDFTAAVDTKSGSLILALVGRARSYAAISYPVESRADAERATKLKAILPREHQGITGAKELIATLDGQGFGAAPAKAAVPAASAPGPDLTRQPTLTAGEAGGQARGDEFELVAYVPAEGVGPSRAQGDWVLMGHPTIGFCALRRSVGAGYVEYRRNANGTFRWSWSDPTLVLATRASADVVVRFDNRPGVTWRFAIDARRGATPTLSAIVPEGWLGATMPRFDKVVLSLGQASASYAFSGFSRELAALNRCST